MKKLISLFFMFIAALLIVSCEKEYSNVNNPSPEKMMERAINDIKSRGLDKNNLKAVTNPIVLLSALKVNCNTYKLTVTLTKPFCKRSSTGYILGYYTLFSGAEGKIINLPPTRSNDCLSGVQINMNYSPTKSTLIEVVFLAYEPATGTFQGYIESNTVSLTPGC